MHTYRHRFVNSDYAASVWCLVSICRTLKCKNAVNSAPVPSEVFGCFRSKPEDSGLTAVGHLTK